MQLLTPEEIDILLVYLNRLFNTHRDIGIKRVAKSLFSLLARHRFSTDNNATPKE